VVFRELLEHHLRVALSERDTHFPQFLGHMFICFTFRPPSLNSAEAVPVDEADHPHVDFAQPVIDGDLGQTFLVCSLPSR
jgi:hypothetical protein